MAIDHDVLAARLEAVIEPVNEERYRANEFAIETVELTKRYESLVAVNRLDLRVERGEIFGFLGPNGAGKTTTMRMLLGLVKPTGGSARVLGMDITTQLPEILRRTGSVIENPTFYPYLSGRDNLRAFARLSGLDEARIAPVLDLVDLTAAAGRRFSTYSLGMKQRLAVGAALLGSPDLLILDEPANGLDPAGIVEMRDLVRRLKTYGHTVLISSHVLHEIEQICDRIAIMSRGRIVVQGRVADLLAGEVLELQVEPAAEALRLLRTLPWVEGVEEGENGLAVRAPASRAAEITRVLAEHGLYLSRLQPREQSLEQYFLDVTGDAA
ncbi:MAG TPA: ABC transporter ATP-binding protein [Chloroflexota bacterium]|nr:ABC transporter ATP-binding protein [Chloroflexota bacterium]